MITDMISSFFNKIDTTSAKTVVALIYCLLVNLIGFFLVIIDKSKAKSHKWRIPERVFFVFAFLGAGIGEYAAMFLVRHKTRHLPFVIGIPLISIVFYGLLFFVLFR